MGARHWLIGLAGAALLAPGFDAAASAGPAGPVAAEDTNTLHADPAVRQGTLPNGLRYVIMRNATPAGGLSLRLAMDVGSYDETDVQHGAAHFVEHMAFSNGDNAHEEGPEKAFARAGVAFGRDINAETGRFSTTYRLDLPKPDPAALDLAFKWLRAVADGTTFTDAAVDRERGIILAEREASLGPATAIEAERQAFHTPNTRAILPVVGTVASLRALNADGLRAFYQAWYRPSDALVVVVGDADPDTLAGLIERSFGAWAAAGPTPVRPPLQPPDEHRGEQTLVRADPHVVSQFEACRVRAPAPDGQDDVARLRRRLLTRLWGRLIKTQLEDQSHTTPPPYLAATVDSDADLREAEVTCLTVVPIDERWEPGLAAAQAELARFAAHGPSEDDLDVAIESLRAELRGAKDQAATRSSINLATDMAEHALRGDVITSPNEDFWAFDAAVETIRPDDVREAFLRDWSGSGPLLSMFAPLPPTAVALQAAWDADTARPAPGPAAAVKALHWAYADFGKSGRVKSRMALTAPDFIRIIFANGVVMNFKQTALEQKNVQVRVRFGAGRREVADRDYLAAQFGAGLMSAGGLGHHSAADVARIFAGNAWQAKLSVADDAFVFAGDTNASSLRSELQVLAADLSDPGFRAEVDSRIPTAIASVYRVYRSQPAFALDVAVDDAVAPGSPLSLPPQEKVAALRMADFQRILKPALTEAPLEVTIVGDVDEASATELVRQTLGALPPRKAGPRELASTWFLRFPDNLPAVVRTTHEGPADRAMIGLLWPLYVATPERRREEVTLRLLAKVFDDSLRHRVRQELGETYSPQVKSVMPDRGNQGYMMAAIETAPENVDGVLAEARRIADQLVKGEISEPDLEAARQPMLAEFTARAAQNSWWVAALDGSARSRESIDELRLEPDLLSSITVAEVRQAASVWLAKAPIAVIATPQATPKAN